MVTMKDARKVLGISENASKSQIAGRYNILLKQHRLNESAGEDGKDRGYSLEEINEAYNLLMGYDTVKTEDEEKPRKPNPVFVKLGIDQKKFNNFIYYYKFYILGGIILLIAILSILKGCIFRVEPDLSVAYLGKIFYNSETDNLKKTLIKSFPAWKEVSIDGAYISPDDKDAQQAYAMQMKAMVLLAAGDVDVYVTDKRSYKLYAKEGAFANLDEIAVKLNVDMEKNKDYILKTNESKDEKHLYGIDVSSNNLLNQNGMIGDEKIISIRINAKHYDNAVKLLELLLK